MAQRPVGITIISILYFVGSAISILGAAVVTLGRSLPIQSPEPGISNLGIAFFLIIYAVISITLGISLLKLRNWARLAAFTLAIIGIVAYWQSIMFTIVVLIADPITGIVMAFLDLIVLAVAGIYIWYLGFNKEVKDAFSTQTETEQKPPLPDPEV